MYFLLFDLLSWILIFIYLIPIYFDLFYTFSDTHTTYNFHSLSMIKNDASLIQNCFKNVMKKLFLKQFLTSEK